MRHAISIGLLMICLNFVWGDPVLSQEPNADKLKQCPSSPNCVPTQSLDQGKHMTPLPYFKNHATSQQTLLSIIESMPRTNIVMIKPQYIHAEFRSMIFRFVDDVEFLFDDGEEVIHFRSASRTGYSDFGVNRKRMQKISDHYLKYMRAGERPSIIQ